MPDDEPQPQGGNRIPPSYLKRFLPSQGQDQNEDMPHDLRLFMETIK